MFLIKFPWLHGLLLDEYRPDLKVKMMVQSG